MVNQAQAEAGEAGICRQAQDKGETVLEVLHAYGGKSLGRGIDLVFVYGLMQHGVTPARQAYRICSGAVHTAYAIQCHNRNASALGSTPKGCQHRLTQILDEQLFGALL